MMKRSGLERPITLELPDEAAMLRLAQDIAGISRAGDVIALSGDLGAGKSTFARAFIRHLADDPGLEAPSPTFTLMQAYDTARGRILHADLYRIRDPDELVELGFAQEAEGAISLIEWPERGRLDADDPQRLEITIGLDPLAGDSVRQVTLTPAAGWRDRLALALAARRLIDRAGWGEARRVHMQGDASSRAYERLHRGGDSAVLMLSPPRPDGPPVRGGKPYSAIARLAERIDAFVAMDRGLAAAGYSTPKIIAEDLIEGVLLIEDLGSEPVTRDGAPIPERYEAAVDVLADLHGRELATILPVAEGRSHVIPDYDADAMMIEVELLLDWYAPHIAGATLPAVARSEFARAWSGLFDILARGPRTWTLRDFHSPNLIWLPDREGLRRIGLIDFQDAVLGPAAYDLVSLGQDARLDVPPALELKLISRYAGLRRGADPQFDFAAFATAYAILGAQRNTKILGIFARLDKRDGKPAYLKHLPRIEGYTARNLAHPALAELRRWYETHMPKLFQHA